MAPVSFSCQQQMVSLRWYAMFQLRNLFWSWGLVWIEKVTEMKSLFQKSWFVLCDCNFWSCRRKKTRLFFTMLFLLDLLVPLFLHSIALPWLIWVARPFCLKCQSGAELAWPLHYYPGVYRGCVGLGLHGERGRQGDRPVWTAVPCFRSSYSVTSYSLKKSFLTHFHTCSTH